LALAYASDAFVRNGPDVVGVRSGPSGWIALGLVVGALVMLLAAAVAEFAA
jgi:hypothetical protein